MRSTRPSPERSSRSPRTPCMIPALTHNPIHERNRPTCNGCSSGTATPPPPSAVNSAPTFPAWGRSQGEARLRPELTLQVESEVIAHTRNACERGAVARAQWQLAFDSWAAANPQRKAPYDRVTARELRTMSPMASAVQARPSIASAVQILSSTASWILSEDFATSSANSVRRGEGTRCPTPTGHRLCSTARGECRRVEPGQRNSSIRRLVRV